MTAIKIEHLHFAYPDKTILRGVNLAIDGGKFTGILGPNGCGKTTLLKNISGYLTPHNGEIIILNRPVNRLSKKEKARLIGYVPQETTSEFNFTNHDVVMMGRMPYLKRFQKESRIDRETVREAMELTRTWDLKDRFINQLSGGERQRIFIARALAQKPSILLMDEPVSHLDIKHQISIINLISSLCHTMGITALVVLHDINLAARYCDNIVLMKDGEIISTGSPLQALTRKNIRNVFDIDVNILRPHNVILPVIPSEKTVSVQF